jgi:hypothetical protein
MRYSVDVIVVLDDLGADHHLITTTTVPLIKWGAKPAYILKVKLTHSDCKSVCFSKN